MGIGGTREADRLRRAPITEPRGIACSVDFTFQTAYHYVSNALSFGRFEFAGAGKTHRVK